MATRHIGSIRAFCTQTKYAKRDKRAGRKHYQF